MVMAEDPPKSTLPTRDATNKIIFINRFFYPDQSATSQLLSDLVFDLAKDHNAIHVITSRMQIDDSTVALPTFELVAGVNIHRLTTSKFGRFTLVGRLFDYLTFYLVLFFKLMAIVKKGDTVICKTDPPLHSIIAQPIVWLRGGILINWLQDIFPEIASALKIKGMTGILGRLLINMRNRSLHGAHINVVLSDNMAAILRSQGIADKRIKIVPNWSNSNSLTPISHSDNTIRSKYGFGDHFIVGYSGNMGRAHDFTTILAAAEKLQDHPEIIFEFVGSGIHLPWIKSESKKRGLKNIFFRAHQQRKSLAESLSVANIHLVSLLPELEGLCFPSKLYGIAAVARPILFVGDQNGDIGKILQKNHCGIAVALGDSSTLAREISNLWQNRELCESMGNNARKMLQESYDQHHAISSWRKILEDLKSSNHV